MAQQINLCLPILRKQSNSFGAQTLMQLLALVLPIAAALGVAWVWNLKQANESLRQTLAAQNQEMVSMREALAQSQEGLGSAQASMQQALEQGRAQLKQRQQALDALEKGRFEPSFGHSARLQMVAQTIPLQAWVSQLRADDSQLEISGYTLEPAVLTQWVSRLAQSSLLKGQALSTITVERVKSDSVLSSGALDRQSVAGAASPLGGTAQSMPQLPPRWSFSLLSSLAKPAKTAQGTP